MTDINACDLNITVNVYPILIHFDDGEQIGIELKDWKCVFFGDEKRIDEWAKILLETCARYMEDMIAQAEKRGEQIGIAKCLQLIPNERAKFIKKEWKAFADEQNVYKHYNIALKDTRKAINDYFNSL